MLQLPDLVGRPYRPPFGCFEAVREAVTLGLGVEVPDYSLDLNEDQKAAAFLRWLPEHCDPVDRPEPWDLVLLRWNGEASHIGIYDEPRSMWHAFLDLGWHRERLDGLRWRNRIMGYWRVRR